ncbi:Receptor-type tyrosine-protein phosphatase delta [Taenia crassiceps]|uniref:Receptor-type tyrosine-protein phosphatase delta n=1 Tax=Taenia crassiceps TaxID=6207 RepID=A0ABR4Q0Y1_9CEST
MSVWIFFTIGILLGVSPLEATSDWQSYWHLRKQIIAPLRPLKLKVSQLEKQPRRFPSSRGDPRSTLGMPYVALELAWVRPSEFANTEGVLIYQVSARPIVLPLVATEARVPESGEFASVLAAKRAGAWVEGTRILANVSTESFSSTEGDDLGMRSSWIDHVSGCFGITYEFQVAVVNSTMNGIVERINVTTPESHPSSFPLKLRVRGISPSEVEVTWEPPALHTRNGRLTSYQVRYYEDGAESETEQLFDVLVPEQLKYTARDLKTQTYYHFMVRAFTNSGPGPWTRSNTFQTTGERPPPPIDVQAIRINQHQIKVTWRMPEVDTSATRLSSSPYSRANYRHAAIQGFQILYAPNDSPYDSSGWTTYEVGPFQMAIISHLQSKSPYIIRVKSKGPDGRYGEWSDPPAVARSTMATWGTDYSVRGLLCIPGLTSAKITWQRPENTKGLVGFNIRASGSKEYADESGVMRRQTFDPRSARQAFFDAQDGYDYVVKDLEPNTIYDIQVNAYYETGMNLESNWETTSCHTEMQKPEKVAPPLPISALEDRKQVNMKVFRVSERLGKIRQYYMMVSPWHLTTAPLDMLLVDEIIASSRKLPSTKTRYIAARFTQDYFEPAGTSSRDFILGGSNGITSPTLAPPPPPFNIGTQRRRRSPAAIRSKVYSANSQQSWLLNDAGSVDEASVAAAAYLDAAVVFDNKPLEAGQVYCALVLACTFQGNGSTMDGFGTCTASPWSPPFATDPYLPALLELRAPSGHISPTMGSTSDSSLAFGSTDLYTVSVVAVILGAAVVTTICTVLVCIFRRRRKPKLLARPTNLDQSLKQPLMNVTDGVASSQAPAGAFYNCAPPITGTICANNGALSMSPPGYTQLVGMPPTCVTYHNGTQDPTVSTHINSFPRSSYPYRSDSSSGLSGGGGGGGSGSRPPMGALFPSVSEDNKGDLMDGSSVSCSVYPTSPRLNGGISRFGGGGPYNTFNRHMLASKIASLGDGSSRGLFANDAATTEDANSVELQHLFYGSNLHSQRPIPAAYLAEHIVKLSADDNRLFSQEYESIDPGHQFTWENSNLEVNKAKNRYANVVAYDHSRVILRALEGVPGSDYINANYIDGYKKPNCYIATQGPLPETYSDFWRMIWEQRVSIIVMMTRLEERARIKCDQYWPSRGPETYANGTVTVAPLPSPEGIIELAYFTIRRFTIAHCSGNEMREVTHLQFTSWPDHGVPESPPIPLLLFMRRIRRTVSTQGSRESVSLIAGGAASTSLASSDSDPATSGPLVVHCSAGVGRTGALIALDIMHDQMKYENAVDVLGCVTALRAQRNFMVQTEEQYIFVYDALLEMAEGGYTEVPARGLCAQYNSLLQPDGMGYCGFDIEFKKLEGFFLPKASFTSALLSPNKCKNRFFEVLPYEKSRVALTPLRGVDGSDYINASFVDSYRARRAYIATQGPMAETLEDFWRMCWEHNSAIIVMISQATEQGKEHSYPYWPSKRSARYQNFVIDPMVEYNMPTYTLREFKVTDTRDGISRTVRQFQYTEWPEIGVPNNCEAFTNFVTQIHKTKDQFGQDGPITVHCSCGSGRTGVFILLSIVLDRLRCEGVVDILQTVRLLRTQRPGMIQSPDQLQFCYKAVLEYISSYVR